MHINAFPWCIFVILTDGNGIAQNSILQGLKRRITGLDWSRPQPRPRYGASFVKKASGLWSDLANRCLLRVSWVQNGQKWSFWICICMVWSWCLRRLELGQGRLDLIFERKALKMSHFLGKNGRPKRGDLNNESRNSSRPLGRFSDID